MTDHTAGGAIHSTEAFERALGKSDQGECVLCLYVSGLTPNSRKAIENVKRICEEYLSGRYRLDIIDIYQQPQLAREAQIVAVPTLVKLHPLPVGRFIGDMSQTERVVGWLGLKGRPAGDRSASELAAEVDLLRRQLLEAEELLGAIGRGGVDALVVSSPEGERIFSLQGAEHPYRVLVETMNEGAATLAPDGTIVYGNGCLAGMLRVPLEKLIGTQLGSYVAAADQTVFARLKKCRKESEKGEILLVTGAGTTVPVLFSCSSLKGTGSLGVSVILTDVSAAKRAKKTILRLNRLYSVLSAVNHVVVHTHDRDAIFREFCRVAVELGGFRLAWVGLVDRATGLVTVAAAEGETGYLDGLLISLHAVPEALGPTSRSILEGTAFICNDFLDSEITGPWQERARAHGLRASASIAIKQNHETIGALALYADEKDFFDAQQVELLQQIGSEVSFALDHISQGVLRRKAELALQREIVERLRVVEELRQHERLLIQQSRMAALGEMIGNIAHQWRQPLNALGVLVQQGPLFWEFGEVDKAFLETNTDKSMELIQHMSRTIDDFRNYFQPDKEKVDFPVHEEVAKTLSLLAGSFQGHEISIKVQAKVHPVIHSYPNEFSQVLLNILLNARDALLERATARPKVAIKIGRKGSRAVVTITDNAGGIGEDIITKIFDPYFTTKGPQSGTGVGLFMSKSIIEKNMGGRLTVRNVRGGAEFRIEV